MNPADAFKRYWGQLTLLAASVAGAAGAFVGDPVVFSQRPTESVGLDITGLQQWLTVALIGVCWLTCVAVSKSRQRRFWKGWLYVALLASIVAMTGNLVLVDRWSVRYAPGQTFRIVTGTVLTGAAATYVKRDNVDPQERLKLLKNFEGDAAQVWDEAELKQRVITIAAVRTLSYLFCVASILFLVLALSVFDGDRGKRPRPA